jgi:hypothetical protein
MPSQTPPTDISEIRKTVVKIMVIHADVTRSCFTSALSQNSSDIQQVRRQLLFSFLLVHLFLKWKRTFQTKVPESNTDVLAARINPEGICFAAFVAFVACYTVIMLFLTCVCFCCDFVNFHFHVCVFGFFTFLVVRQHLTHLKMAM